MRALTQVVLAATELDDRLLLAFAVALHGGDHLATVQERGANLDLIALSGEQHLIELDIGTNVGREFFNSQDQTFADAILLSTRGDYGVHDLPELQTRQEDPGIKGREVYGDGGSQATPGAEKSVLTRI